MYSELKKQSSTIIVKLILTKCMWVAFRFVLCQVSVEHNSGLRNYHLTLGVCEHTKPCAKGLRVQGLGHSSYSNTFYHCTPYHLLPKPQKYYLN